MLAGRAGAFIVSDHLYMHRDRVLRVLREV